MRARPRVVALSVFRSPVERFLLVVYFFDVLRMCFCLKYAFSSIHYKLETFSLLILIKNSPDHGLPLKIVVFPYVVAWPR